MTFKQAKTDFAIFAVFVPVTDKKGKRELERVDNVPDDTEGRVGVCDLSENMLGILPISSAPRLCFIAKKEIKKNEKETW